MPSTASSRARSVSLWQARPIAARRAFSCAGSFLLGIPFFFFALACLFDIPDSAGNAPFGFVLLLVATTLLLSPWHAWWIAHYTLYVVTNRRAVVIEAPPWRVLVRTFSGATLAGTIRREELPPPS